MDGHAHLGLSPRASPKVTANAMGGLEQGVCASQITTFLSVESPSESWNFVSKTPVLFLGNNVCMGNYSKVDIEGKLGFKDFMNEHHV